jgi:hypothetical protein
MNQNNNNEEQPNLIPDNPTNRVGGRSPRGHFERLQKEVQQGVRSAQEKEAKIVCQGA